MFEELQYIELSGKAYPIKCDLLVLEKIQEAYESISRFEQAIMTWEPELDADGNESIDKGGKTKYRFRFPEARAVNDALAWMVNEGEVLAAEQEGRTAVKYTREELSRKADIPLTELANKLHDEFYRCFEIKNGKTTQRKQKAETVDQ